MSDPFPWMLQLMGEYRDAATVPIVGMGSMVVVWGPSLVEAVFRAPPDAFAPGTNEALAVIVGRGSLFLKAGDEHRRARKLLMPPFHGERMRAYGAVMRATTLRWAETLREGVSRPILETAQAITLDIIIEAIFGARDGDEVAALRAAILGVVEAFNPLIATFRWLQKDFGGFGPWAKFQKRADTLHDLMRRLMEAKRATPSDDILSLLLSVRDEDGAPMPESEVIDQLLTFVVAGHETTATTLAWAMYELHRSPETLATLRAELSGASEEAVPKLPYLDAVCEETLRMHPPVPIVPRKLVKPLVVGEYALPEGTTVGVSPFMAQHRAETFAEPLRFQPERFVGRKYEPSEHLPFGGGARRCLGAAFAMYELKVVLATLLGAGTFRLDEPVPVKNAFRIGTYGPATGVRMTRLPAGA